MRRLALLTLTLAATLTACLDDYPAGPSGFPRAVGRVVALEMMPGDSIDLAVVAAERFGMLAVADCASTDTEVASLFAVGQLRALGAGESTIRCAGALHSRLDPTIDDGGAASDPVTWVTFDVVLRVLEAEETPASESPTAPDR